MTEDLGDGIQMLLGVKKEGEEEKTSTQSYHFDKEKWKPKAVKKWLREHNETPIELEMAKKDTEVKEDASGSIVSRKGDVIPEQVPIDRVPEKLFGNVRQQDVPELLEATIDADVTIQTVEERPDDEVLMERSEPEGVSEDYDEEFDNSDRETEKIPVNNTNPNFSPIRARDKLVDWATGEDGKVNKKPLLKWFLDIDGGPAQTANSYRYPTGYVIDNEPQYCKLSLDSSWDLASGNQTGVANRNIQKKIIFIKNREGMPLTEEQIDFTERHMSAEKVTYHTLEDDNSPGGIDFVDHTELKLNSSPAGSKIIYEDDSVIDVPVVPMREGVFTGTDGIPTLKKFEYFGKDAHWLEGQPILKGHTAPTELVTYKHNRIGKLMNVTARPDKKDVVAVARYYKEKLTPEDLTRIRSGTPYDGSIAYTTHTSMTPGELNGTKYNAVEDGGYHFYHFAELANGIGACSTKDGCGFMLNEKEIKSNSAPEPIIFYNDKRRAEVTHSDGSWSIKLNSSVGGSGLLEATTEQDALEWSRMYVKSGLIPINMQNNYNYSNLQSQGNDNMTKLNEKKGMVKDADGNECMFFEMKDKKCPVKDEEEDIEEMLDDEEEAPIETKTKEKKNSRFSGNKMATEYIEADMDVQKMNEAFEQKLNERDAKIAELTEQVEDLVQKQNAIEQAQVEKKAQEDFEAFTQKLNKAHQKDASVHYEGFKTNGWAYFDANPGIFRAEIVKQNAMGSPAAEGDNATALQQARDMLKKAQKERFSKRA